VSAVLEQEETTESPSKDYDEIKSKIQGNVLRAYGHDRVRYFMLKVAKPAAARQWLGAIATDEKHAKLRITTEEEFFCVLCEQLSKVSTLTAKQNVLKKPPGYAFNIAMTWEGLKALGLPDDSLSSFPIEFRQGMHRRAVKLGDIGKSAPSTWPAPFDDPSDIHLIASIYASSDDELKYAQDLLEDSWIDKPFNVKGIRDGLNFEKGMVHFGYKDGISQPRFEGVPDPKRYEDCQPKVTLGTLLLGKKYKSEYEGVQWKVPFPKEELGENGCFNAFRVLSQDVVGFEDYLDTAAKELMQSQYSLELLPDGEEKKFGPEFTRFKAFREIVAAKMCGRWRNGAPLELYPKFQPPNPDKRTFSEFDYGNAKLDGPVDGSRCPFGAHTRRANPRGAHIVQRVANNTRRLVRRGMPYGPEYKRGDGNDGIERGLLGNFLGADLGAQFEAVMCDWLNLGAQDTRITGYNDPLLGANDPDISSFEILLESGKTIRLQGLPRFIHCRGGAYTFIPSLPAIRYLASL